MLAFNVVSVEKKYDIIHVSFICISCEIEENCVLFLRCGITFIENKTELIKPVVSVTTVLGSVVVSFTSSKVLIADNAFCVDVFCVITDVEFVTIDVKKLEVSSCNVELSVVSGLAVVSKSDIKAKCTNI